MAVLRPAVRNGRYLIPGCLAIVLALPASAQQSVDRPEYEVKAAYLFNFLQYVEWPPTSLGGDSPVILCVFGDDPLGDVLRRVIGGRRAGGRAVRVEQIDRPLEADRCHAGFIAASNGPPEGWLRRLRTKPILTVGEGTGFAAAGGMIAFVVVEETIRFEINVAAVRAGRLQLSSRVVRLANRVYDD